MIKVWSITDKLILGRDEKKRWYEVNKKDVQVGQKIKSSLCTPLSDNDCEFHESIKELDEVVYGPKL